MDQSVFKDIVFRFAQESKCQSKHVACLAVKNKRIISTGINGTPSGYINCDEYFKQKHKELVIEMPYSEWIKTPEWRELHHDWSNIHELHGEVNCVCEANKNGISLEGCDIYLTLQPCIHCAKLLASVGVKNIYYIEPYDKGDKRSLTLLKDCGINVQQI